MVIAPAATNRADPTQCPMVGASIKLAPKGTYARRAFAMLTETGLRQCRQATLNAGPSMHFRAYDIAGC